MVVEMATSLYKLVRACSKVAGGSYKVVQTDMRL